MKTNLIPVFLTLSALLLLTQFSCTSDKLPEPSPNENCDNYDATYDGDVKAIIDATCALAGCHVNGGGGPGVFSSYAEMQASGELSDQGFREYVVVLRDDPQNGMPPDWDTNPGPKDLTDEQFEIIKCWIDAGYPEN